MKNLEHYLATHLCQGQRDMPDCPSLFIYRGQDGERDSATGKKLTRYAVYCRRDGLRTVSGNLASWTGLAPKWCPLRQRAEGELHGNDE